MKLRFLKGRFPGRTVELIEAGFTIGRDADSSLQLDEEGISRRHCRLFAEGGRWYIEDLGSTNGVRVNGKLTSGRQALQVGDRLGIYNQTLLFTDGRDVVELAPETVGAGDTAKTAPAAPVPVEPARGPSAVPPAPVRPEGASHEPPPPAPAAEPARAPLPWARLMLLLIIAAALAWIVRNTLFNHTDDAEEADASEQADAGEAAPALPTEPADTATQVRTVTPSFGEPSPKAPPPPEGTVAGQPPPTPPPTVTVARPPEAAPLPPPAAGEARPVTLVVESNPPGAQMTLNEQPRGVTPCVVRDLAPGRHMLKLSLDGYEDLVRQIYNPGMLPEEPYELHLKAGVVRIVSTPPGAVVVHGSQILGITPLIVRDLPAGRQELRVFAHGYEPRVVEVATSAVRGDTLNVELASLLGDLEVITIPAGCAVWVDRTEKGRTVRQEDGRNQSQPLRIGGLREGEHELRIVHPNGAEKVETVTVRRGQAATSVARLWVLDTKLVLNDGTTRHGMLVQVNEFGDVILAEPRPNRYLKEQVAEVRPLTPDEARALQGGRNAPDEAPPAPEAKPPAPAPGTPPDDGLAPELLPPRDTGAEAAPPEQPMLLAADELTQTLRRETVTNVGRRFNGKAVTVTGTPTATRSNEIRATVSLGPSIQCEIDRAHYEEVKERIRNAQEKTQALSFAGRAITHGQNLILRECRVTEPPANEEGQR